MRLAQLYTEKLQQESNGATQTDKNKYTKNFSSLPTKTGAMYKEAYKEKMRKEKEEKEKDKEDKAKEMAKPVYGRTGTSSTNSTIPKSNLTSTTVNSNGQVSSKQEIPKKTSVGGVIGNVAPSKTPDSNKINKDKESVVSEDKGKRGSLREDGKLIGLKASKYSKNATEVVKAKVGPGSSNYVGTNGRPVQSKITTQIKKMKVDIQQEEEDEEDG